MEADGPLILNLGSGREHPISNGEIREVSGFEGSKVINYDFVDRSHAPYASFWEPGDFRQKLSKLSKLSKKELNEEDRLKWENIYSANVNFCLFLDDCSVDVVIAVSPHGYSVLNEEVYRVLKPEGIVIMLGNGANKFFTKEKFYKSKNLSNLGDFYTLFEHAEAKDRLVELEAHLFGRESYVTGGAKKTNLHECKIFRKVRIF
ncbi:hypothetical protein ACJJIX_11310 [Microbulbifer sp. VAAC004]|uniref:hypothetical protein n=1 Tax=unclassified Microbulbifer TaxID=2619833 RepID=UPI004039F474